MIGQSIRVEIQWVFIDWLEYRLVGFGTDDFKAFEVELLGLNLTKK